MKPSPYIDSPFLWVETCAGRIYYGPAPMGGVLDELLAIPVKLIWNLGEELEWLVKREREKFEVVWTPIQDYSIPDHDEFEQDLNQVETGIRAGIPTFIHCCGGHGRTGIALAALMVRLEKMSVFDALKYAKSLCNGPELPEQRAFVRELFECS